MNSTIKDVAVLANVSISTVSRVINNDPRISAQTVKNVQRAIAECNYIPNTNARSLKSSRSNTIGLVVSDISNLFFSSMAKYIENYLESKGYSLILCCTDENSVREKNAINRLISQQIDGLIINTCGKNDAELAKISKTIPVVLIERNVRDPSFHGDYVADENNSAIRLMTEHFLENGHTRIGFINGELSVSTAQERYEAFVDTMKSAGIDVYQNYPYIFNTGFGLNNGYSGAEQLMKLPHPPTAIISTNTPILLGILRYLKLNNYRIPEDVSLLSYGNIEYGDLFYASIGYSTHNPHSTGKKAAEFVLSRIEHPEIGNRQCIFDPSLMSKDSVKTIQKE